MREEVIYKVFLNLSKAYGTLDRERCLVILVAYGVGPRTNRLLQMYWERITVVYREGRYYVNPFTSTSGVT